MKKFLLFGSGFLLLCIFIIFCLFFSFTRYYNVALSEFEQTETVESNQYFKVLSNKTGIQFQSWQEIRRFIYCTILRKGMTRKEVESSLSIFGKLEHRGLSDLSFENELLREYLGVFVLEYDSFSELGKLTGWSSSTIQHYSIPCFAGE